MNAHPGAIVARISASGWTSWVYGTPRTRRTRRRSTSPSRSAAPTRRPHHRLPTPGRHRGDDTLLGRADAFADGVMRIAPGLARDLAAGDANYLSLLDAADAYAAREGLDLPEEPAARVAEPEPSCTSPPPSCGWTCAKPGSPRSSGRPGLRSISAGCRSERWTRVGRRSIGAASPRCPGCMSWGCPFCPAGRRASFLEWNRTQRVWRSISPRGVREATYLRGVDAAA